MARGILKLYIGNMASGKTGHLILAVETLREYGKRNIIAFKPIIDTRSDEGKIESRPGKSIGAFEVDPNKPKEIIEIIKDEEGKNKKFDTIVFDEVQFYSEKSGFFWIVKQLLADGYDVIAAGLALDFHGEPFGSTLWLAVLAQGNCEWLNSCCTKCGEPAAFPQRMIDGKPAPYNSPLIAVGGDELYEPRCENCFIPPQKTNK